VGLVVGLRFRVPTAQPCALMERGVFNAPQLEPTTLTPTLTLAQLHSPPRHGWRQQATVQPPPPLDFCAHPVHFLSLTLKVAYL
jgi:hypothetical protein